MAGVIFSKPEVRLLGRLTVQTDIRLYCVQGQVSAITDYCIREREPKTKWQPFVFRYPWIDLTPNRRPFRQPKLTPPPDNRDPFQTRAYKLRWGDCASADFRGCGTNGQAGQVF